MFHAPTTETKQSDPGRSQSTPERTRELSPSVSITMGPASSGASAGAAPPDSGRGFGRPLARLHSTYGNQAILRMLSRAPVSIQTKLTVNQPGDQFEQEADRVADQVMRMAAPRSIQWKCASCEEKEKLQRKCADCAAEEKKIKLQKREVGAGPGFAPPIVHDVLRSPGQPLDAGTRAFFEPRFGHDFSQVRVHTDDRAAKSAKAVNARAYTAANNIVFGAGQHNPRSTSGQRLLAHELTHVLQQNPKPRAAPPAVVQRDPAPPTSDESRCGGITVTNFKISGGGNPRSAVTSAGVLNLSGGLNASATVSVTGSDFAGFEFGFIQMCRPFETVHAAYRKPSAAAGAGQDLDVDVSAEARAVEPQQDHPGVFAAAPVSPKGSGAPTSVVFNDVPSQHFPDKLMKQSEVYNITGLQWRSWFFLALAVKMPSGTILPLRTFYWDIGLCEAPIGNTSTTGPNSIVNFPKSPDSCVLCRDNCDKSQIKPGPATKTCNSEVLPIVNLSNRDLLGTLPKNGPGNFDVSCT